jgi:hypothetical protein
LTFVTLKKPEKDATLLKYGRNLSSWLLANLTDKPHPTFADWGVDANEQLYPLSVKV